MCVCNISIFCSDVRAVGVSVIHREQLHVKGVCVRSKVMKTSEKKKKKSQVEGRTRVTDHVGEK